MWTLLRLLLVTLRLLPTARRDLVLENLALRHQLAVCARPRRPPLSDDDRRFWSALARDWPRWRDVLVLVPPETVVRWHRTPGAGTGAGRVGLEGQDRLCVAHGVHARFELGEEVRPFEATRVQDDEYPASLASIDANCVRRQVSPPRRSRLPASAVAATLRPGLGTNSAFTKQRLRSVRKIEHSRQPSTFAPRGAPVSPDERFERAGSGSLRPPFGPVDLVPDRHSARRGDTEP